MEPTVIPKMNTGLVLPLVLVLFQLHKIECSTALNELVSSGRVEDMLRYQEYRDRALRAGRDYELGQENAYKGIPGDEVVPFHEPGQIREEIVYIPTRLVHLMESTLPDRDFGGYRFKDTQDNEFHDVEANTESSHQRREHLAPSRHPMISNNQLLKQFPFDLMPSQNFSPELGTNEGRSEGSPPYRLMKSPYKVNPGDNSGSDLVPHEEHYLDMVASSPRMPAPQSLERATKLSQTENDTPSSPTSPDLRLPYNKQLGKPKSVDVGIPKLDTTGPARRHQNPNSGTDDHHISTVNAPFIRQKKPNSEEHNYPDIYKTSEDIPLNLHEFSKKEPTSSENKHNPELINQSVNLKKPWIEAGTPNVEHLLDFSNLSPEQIVNLYPKLKHMVDLYLKSKGKSGHSELDNKPSDIPESDGQTRPNNWYEKLKNLMPPGVREQLFGNGETEKSPNLNELLNSSPIDFSKSKQKMISNIIQDFLQGAKRTKRQLGMATSLVNVITVLFQLGFYTFGSIIRAIFQFAASLISYIPQFLP